MKVYIKYVIVINDILAFCDHIIFRVGYFITIRPSERLILQFHRPQRAPEANGHTDA